MDANQDIAAIRAVVESIDERVAQLSAKQGELIQTVEGLSASVDKLNGSFTTVKAQLAEMAKSDTGGGEVASGDDVVELRRQLQDVTDTMGTAVLNVHRDFAMVLRQIGPAFDQVQKTVVPFAAAATDFANASPAPAPHLLTADAASLGGNRSSSVPIHMSAVTAWGNGAQQQQRQQMY